LVKPQEGVVVAVVVAELVVVAVVECQ